jgi:hypothetical protein
MLAGLTDKLPRRRSDVIPDLTTDNPAGLVPMLRLPGSFLPRRD